MREELKVLCAIGSGWLRCQVVRCLSRRAAQGPFWSPSNQPANLLFKGSKHQVAVVEKGWAPCRERCGGGRAPARRSRLRLAVGLVIRSTSMPSGKTHAIDLVRV